MEQSLDEYRRALQELTFNSKPIINSLTMMAGERARSISGPVARATLDHLVAVGRRSDEFP